MINRCTNDAPQHRNHHGRGIKVCVRWRDSFEAFYSDMGPRPSQAHHIDRYPDQDGDYGPGNCRWVLPKENARNKRNNHLLVAFGESKTMVEWSEDHRCRVSYDALKRRINTFNWDQEAAISTPSIESATTRVAAFGETKSLADWSRDPRCATDYHRLKHRIVTAGWEAERAITTSNRKGSYGNRSSVPARDREVRDCDRAAQADVSVEGEVAS
jgi:hypothetical protein